MWGISPLTGEFPAQMASNAEMFPFDDVIKKMVQYNDSFISTVDTGGLVLLHQTISSHIDENARMCFQLLRV